MATKRGWALRRCSRCGLIFVWPQPEPQQLDAVYRKSSGYFAGAGSDLSKSSPRGAIRLHNKLASLGMSRGSFLDVGCGTGQMVYHMQRLGWQSMGIDINADTVSIARENGLDVTAASLETAQLSADSFDVVHMGDVLEHVRSPRQTFLACRRLLSRNGAMVIRTPNWQCGFGKATLAASRLLRLPWAYSEAPYHLYDFCPTAILRLARATGFEVTSLECSGRVRLLYAVGGTGCFDDLKLLLKGCGKQSRLREVLLNAPKLSVVGAWLLPLWIWGTSLDWLAGSGKALTIVARRRH